MQYTLHAQVLTIIRTSVIHENDERLSCTTIGITIILNVQCSGYSVTYIVADGNAFWMVDHVILRKVELHM